MDLALKTGVPIIGMLDSGGARIQEGVVALGKYGEIFRRNTQASGVIPQISIIMGPAAGGAVYSPALTDFVIMVDKTSQMFVTGPDVIKTVTGEDVGMEELGGALTHNTISGVAHWLAVDEDDALDYARTLIGFLPDNNLAELPVYESDVELEITDEDRKLNTLIPDSPNQPYDVKTAHRAHRRRRRLPRDAAAVRARTSSSASAGSRAARSASSPTSPTRWPAPSTSRPARSRPASCGSATRSRSRSSPSWTSRATCRAPTRSGPASSAAARSCCYAYAEATVPLVTVITRKAYGGAYIVMGSKQLGADLNYAWPTAEIAVMGGQGAVNILYRGEIKAAEDDGEDVAAVRTQARQRVHLQRRQPVPRRRARRARRRDRAGRDPRRRSSRRCARCGPSARACRPRSTGTSRCDRRRRNRMRRPALFSVIAGNPTPSELAAVTRRRRGHGRGTGVLAAGEKLAGPTGWERSARPVAVASSRRTGRGAQFRADPPELGVGRAAPRLWAFHIKRAKTAVFVVGTPERGGFGEKPGELGRKLQMYPG